MAAVGRGLDLAGLAPPVALVLSGGGARGSAQAGAVVELVEAGLRPDFVVGTSIGAWNGAWVAAHPEPERVGELLRWWTDPDVGRLFRGMWLGYAGALAWRRSAALSADRVERFLARAIGDVEFSDLALPLTIGALDLLSSDLVYLDSGPVADAVRASSAIPTVLPPVDLGSRLFVDAGVVDNFGVAEAIRRGAGTVVLVDASTGMPARPPVGLGEILDRAALAAAVHQRRHAEAAAAYAGVRLGIVEVGGIGATLDFRRPAEAFVAGRRRARAWLDGEPVSAPSPPDVEERNRMLKRWARLERALERHLDVLQRWRRLATSADGGAASEDVVDSARR